MIKRLPKEGFQILTFYTQQIWKDPDYDHKAWHKTKLMLLYKGKGKIEDLNNWRRICLKETLAKVLSSILAKRLLLNLGKIKAGVNQFGHISCQEPFHTLHSALILRWQYGLKTYAFFVDLIKAVNTIDHTLLLQVLSMCGIPPKMQRTIKKLYMNFTVQLEVGEEKYEIKYNTRVQQGNNMAPFLFYMWCKQWWKPFTKNWPPTNFNSDISWI